MEIEKLKDNFDLADVSACTANKICFLLLLQICYIYINNFINDDAFTVALQQQIFSWVGELFLIMV